ncbi:Uncharacterised protein [uncultured archaeon]|nr:Uncharacterised protein [uncultured archaeon]
MGKRGFCRRKSGQMELSFGMIFSIILIIAFVAFSVYGIIKFLEFRDSAQIGTFEKNFATHVKAKWAGTEGAETHEYTLPGRIKEVCFISKTKPITDASRKEELKWINLDEGENLFFYPLNSAGNAGSAKIDYLNIDETTKDDNPFCILNKNGKVRLTLQKNYGENSVRVLRAQ